MFPQIVIVYTLSLTGQQAALATGVNAGKTQLIVLRPPGFKVPEATPEVQAVVVAAENLTTPPADFGEAAKALVNAMATLAVALDPAAGRNVHVEIASVETWTLAASLAILDDAGNASIRIGDSHGYIVQGYTVVEASSRYNEGPPFQVREAKDLLAFDSIQTANTLLPAEKVRRDSLEPLRQAALDDAARKMVQYCAERDAKAFEGNLENAKRELAEVPERFRDLPEVALLTTAIETRDPSIVGDYEQRPQSLLRNAMESALKAEKNAERDAWIVRYGSEHLNRLLAEKMVDEHLYKEERLTKDRPGWVRATINYNNGGTPSVDDFRLLRLLDIARKEFPTVELGYVFLQDEGSRLRGGGSGFRPVMKFLGDPIYFTGAM